MSTARLRLGFAGTPDFAVPALRRLAAIGDVRAVFTQPDRPAGRGQGVRSSPVKLAALALDLPVLQPPTLKSAAALEVLRALELQALIVVAYGLILPAPLLEVPAFGCINIHASLLPRWRGAAPIQRAILAGDERTGVTIMRMAAGLDTGPMLSQRSTDITAADTAATLHDRLAEMGADLIAATLPSLSDGAFAGEPQPTDGVTYASKISKAEARLDWSRDALDLWRQVRAFNPWPVAETRWRGAQLRVWEAELGSTSGEAGSPGEVLEATTHGILVACGRGTLRLLGVQLAGRKPLLAADFLKGQPLVGARFGDP